MIFEFLHAFIANSINLKSMTRNSASWQLPFKLFHRTFIQLAHLAAVRADKMMMVKMIKIALILDLQHSLPRLHLNDSQPIKIANITVNRVVAHFRIQLMHKLIDLRHVDVFTLKLIKIL